MKRPGLLVIPSRGYKDGSGTSSKAGCLTPKCQQLVRAFVVPLLKAIELDCEQSLFSSKIRGKERKTRNHASVTVRVTGERRCHKPLVAWALGDKQKERLHRFHTTIWMLL